MIANIILIIICNIIINSNSNTVRPLLSAVLGRTKFWSQKPRIKLIEVRIIEVTVFHIGWTY